MLPRRPGPCLAPLLLGLLLLRLPPARSHTTPSAPAPGAAKAGVCPPPKGERNCTVDCMSDVDCKDNLKCCPDGCASLCLMPNEKKGSCPQINPGIPMLGLCFNECQMDSECRGQAKCCLNGCGKVSCVTPNF
ncbi:WAP four-disulfide core domain protein 2 [Tamandua tetradactyla]|uniref:WAP four-disulfide core domain protein 2 n=1 Tax=Tamandua tetradactyla TaxID=48850 RepID=UPI004053846B